MSQAAGGWLRVDAPSSSGERHAQHFRQHAFDQFLVNLFREQGINMFVADFWIGPKEMQVLPVPNAWLHSLCPIGG